MMKSLFLVAFLAVAALADSDVQVREKKDLSVSIEFEGNATVSNNGADYSYRRMDIYEFGNLGVFHSSVEVQGEAELQDGDASATFEASGIFGMALTGILGAYAPFSMMGYFNIAGDLEAEGQSNAAGFDFAGSSAFLGIAYPNIVEIDSSGAVVRTVGLNSLAWTGNLNTAVEQDGKVLKYYVMSGTNSLLYSNLEITIGYVVSNVIGTLSTGAVITPKSVETQIEIMNYPYADPANKLRLTMVIADARQQGTASGTIYGNTYVAGEGSDQVYVTFAGEAAVDGSMGSVEVELTASTEVEVSNSGATMLIATFTALSGTHDTDVYVATVDFPPNAASISYDPSAGFENPGSAAISVPTFISLFAVLFALFKNL